MLPHRDDGQLFSAREGLQAFDAFGVEVAGYMRFVTYTGRICWVAFGLNLFGILSNLGGGYGSDLLAAHSLNNAECLDTAYAVIEALTSALFVCYVYWMRSAQREMSDAIRADEDAGELLTAANFSVLATRCPPTLNTCASQQRLRLGGRHTIPH